jgi:hypothetical protein
VGYCLAPCYHLLTEITDREAKEKAEDKERYMKVRQVIEWSTGLFSC